MFIGHVVIVPSWPLEAKAIVMTLDINKNINSSGIRGLLKICLRGAYSTVYIHLSYRGKYEFGIFLNTFLGDVH